MSAIDLQLERTGSSGPITAYLISPGGAQAFSSELPDRLGKAYGFEQCQRGFMDSLHVALGEGLVLAALHAGAHGGLCHGDGA
jgi:hypothetical protein